MARAVRQSFRFTSGPSSGVEPPHGGVGVGCSNVAEFGPNLSGTVSICLWD
jgi:hypothetical protein